MKFKQLKPNNIIRVGDWVTLDQPFKKEMELDQNEYQALGSWVKLTDKASYWIGRKVSDSGFKVAREVIIKQHSKQKE